MKVLVTGDTQRPGERATVINWLYHLCRIRWPEAEVLDCAPSKWTIEEWQGAVQGTEGVPTEVLLKAQLGKYDLVIGFELPERALSQLTEHGIPWVDLIIYPIRYGPDLLFGARYHETNAIEFKSSEYWQNEFKNWAFIERAKSARQGVLIESSFALIIGQVEGDKSLVDAAPLKEDMFPEHPMIYFKPHPYDTNNYSPWPSIEGNIYKLLSEPTLQWVGGWNSSVLLEAKYFGVETHQLGPSWWKDHQPLSLSNLLQINCYPGALRRSLGSDWGYQK